MDKIDITVFNPALVGVDVVATFLPDHSQPESEQYAFAYTITISNSGDLPVQLLSRHWLITDANNNVQEVRGEGVVGEQPIIGPGEHFRYTSGATLATPVGYMEGSYFMVIHQGDDVEPGHSKEFEVPIPAFSLHTPRALH